MVMGRIKEVINFNYRNRTNILSHTFRKEVDFLLHKGDIFCGLECKSTETIQRQHFTGLKDLSEALTSRIMHGIILYNGNEIISFSDKFLAVPLRCII